MGKPLEKKQSKLKNIFKNIFIISIAVTLETIIIIYPVPCAIMGWGVKSAWSNTGFVVTLVVAFFVELSIGLGGSSVVKSVGRLVSRPNIGGIRFSYSYLIIFIIGWLLWYAFRCLLKEFLFMIKGFLGSAGVRKYSFLRSLSSFFVGYVIIVLIFSLWFYACYLEGIYFTEGKSNSPFFSVDNINYPQWWDFIYYSFVTMTTLGYGDITPLKVFPQILVTFESTIGVMLPAIFIGIILYVASKNAEMPKPRDSDEPDY
jgi:hypothetical protein